jgi:hypothetical protein
VQKLPFVDVEKDEEQDWDGDTRGPDDRRLAPDLPGDTAGAFKIYFLKLTRASDVHDGFNLCNGGMNSSVAYHTNLTYLVPLAADATGELDDGVAADDNMCLYFGYGETGPNACPAGPASVAVTFDVPVTQPLHGLTGLRGYYVDQAWPNFYETDENEMLSVWSPGGPFAGMGTLGEAQEWAEDAFYLADEEPGEGDYTYLLSFRRCHLATHTACTNVIAP